MVSANSERQLQITSLRRERRWVAALCLLAAVRVFIYGAAFPFFNSIDEPAHFDTVVKYSHGDVPRKFELWSVETMRDVALYDSRAYSFPDTNVVPAQRPWTLPPKAQDAWAAVHSPPDLYTNYESSQPPLYYAYAGSWWWLSGKLHVNEGERLYGLHFLNIPVIILIVWLGWLAAKQVFPENSFRRLAVAALIAAMPQSAFYSIENDVFPPLFFSLAFVGLLRFWASETPSPALAAVTGLALAAAFLAKITSTFPIIVFMTAVALMARGRWRQGKLSESLPAFFSLCTSAAVPALAWMVHCKLNFGDLTGSKARADYWTWTPKPFLQWWYHPIFTPHGAIKFMDHFLPQFWQGEFLWHNETMSFRAMDWVYTLATVGLFAIALGKIIRRPAALSSWQRQVLWLSFSLFASTVIFLVYISIAFNFNTSPNPSWDVPYLFCGRQALAATIPFMLVFASGLDNVMERFRDRAKFIVLIVIVLLMTAIEADTNGVAFASPYNWYHL